MKIVKRITIQAGESLVTFERNGTAVTRRVRIPGALRRQELFYILRKKAREADLAIALLEEPGRDAATFNQFCEVPVEPERFEAWMPRAELERWFPELCGVASPFEPRIP